MDGVYSAGVWGVLCEVCRVCCGVYEIVGVRKWYKYAMHNIMLNKM